LAVDEVLVVDRDDRKRPRMTWRGAWRQSDHLGGTISASNYARNAIGEAGWRAVALPAAVCLALTLAFVGGAFVAAVLAGEAESAEGRGFFLILASVGLSQVLTLLQGQHPAKRLFVAAEARAREPPAGWGLIGVRVANARTPEAKRRLQTRFPYVEAIYHRRGADSVLYAWSDERDRHGSTLEPDVDAVLGDMPHSFTGTSWW
jgi:hypothetical protein